MTEQEQVEKVMEQIARRIYYWVTRSERNEGGYNETHWDEISEEDKTYWRKYYADQILSLPGLAIISEDQSLPENQYRSVKGKQFERNLGAKVGYTKAQIHMLEAGFKRVIKVEGKGGKSS